MRLLKMVAVTRSQGSFFNQVVIGISLLFSLHTSSVYIPSCFWPDLFLPMSIFNLEARVYEDGKLA